jgi:hypothetical protein
MSDKKLGGPFAACVECDKLDSCPIPSSRPSGVHVEDPNKCVLRQMAKPDLANIANQLVIQLGLVDLERIRLEKKLEIVDEVLTKKGTIYRARPV